MSLDEQIEEERKAWKTLVLAAGGDEQPDHLRMWSWREQLNLCSGFRWIGAMPSVWAGFELPEAYR